MPTDQDNPWFVAQLKPNGLSLAQTHLARQGFSSFAPLLPARVQVRRGKRVAKHAPVFPGYIFVAFDLDDRGWLKINSTRGIARLIANDPRRPSEIPAEFMAALFARCDADSTLMPPQDLQVGDRVRVLTGPFADMVTNIEALPDQDRLSILIDLMGRKVRTSLPRSSVERARLT